MTFNPYITQHYGSSMELISGIWGGAEGKEEGEVDAAVGFRRFPNAVHMTHTVFKPKNASAARATITSMSMSPLANGPNRNFNSNSHSHPSSSSRADVCDVLACFRQRRGVLEDNFPSRPVTPKGSNSLASLPPLLPADHSSVSSTDSLRDRGAGLLRNWVKAVNPTNSSSGSSTTSSSSSSAASPLSAGSSPASPTAEPQGATASAFTAAAGELADVSHRPEHAVSTPPVHVYEEVGTECNSQHRMELIDRFPKCGVRASPPRLPVTAAAVFKAVSSADSAITPSVSVSPVSPHLGSNAKAMLSNESPIPTLGQEGKVDHTMGWMLQRSREALEHVQRVLGETPGPGKTTVRPLIPPPPLPTEEYMEETKLEDTPLMSMPAVEVDNDATVTPTSFPQEKSLEDSLGFVSPLTVNQNATRSFPASTEMISGEERMPRASVLSAFAHHNERTAGLDVPRFMVLSRVTDPESMVVQRMRRRNPNGQQQEQQKCHHSAEGSAFFSSPQVREAPTATSETSFTRQCDRMSPQHKIAEVAHNMAALVSPHTAAPRKEAVCEANPICPSPSVNSPIHAAARTSTQLCSDSPCRSLSSAASPPSVGPSKSTETAPPARTPHEDPSLLQELVDFLRAGNPSGFSNLSAALTTPTPVAITRNKTSPARARHALVNSTRRRTASRRQHHRLSSHQLVATTTNATIAPPAPTALLGNPSLPVSQFDRSFTPSSQLARVNTQEVAATTASIPTTAGAAASSGVSSHRPPARLHRPNPLPSYAQPTISWLSKGSEASADDFPVTHATSALTNAVGEEDAA